MKRNLFIAAFFILLLGGGYVLMPRDPEIEEPKPVFASSYPVYFFTREIAGDKVQVENITPAGKNPHQYEPSPAQLSALAQSPLVVMSGIEPWAARVKNSLAGDVPIVVAGPENTDDPHVWLSPQTAKGMVGKILEGLSAAYPGNKHIYELNANGIISNLEQLDIAYKEGLANCKRRDFMLTHSSFEHLAKSYDLMQIPITGASAPELSKFAAAAKMSNITVIFYDSPTTQKLAETIAGESGAKTMLLDPIEDISAEDLLAGKSYLTKMRDNLESLRNALECR